ncbi:His6 protein [Candida orthopsilosis Co 90-125]|uniref:1-(5-phosphoribosyl)-5-[(5-phosphoribosylamino)methylideneamino] imidazole-4-carboxamide isomerase n=1 Tax=Candida orthopsilosis (strain 90-125) TaxID=1136231 RepID=H8WZB0_CANO9|nr:His6 protein [Candida orthopsilosis Co 90-125]CCG21778.1 His6 protein [Candida orthopsilosis Co 90-125]
MTKFRGCIDIHSGQVKQIVGGTLTQDDTLSSIESTQTLENFVSTKPSSYYAQLYSMNNLQGCHVIKLGSNPENDKAAELACKTWPKGLQVGGGINLENAQEWLDKGASHIIITSWLFSKNEETGKMELDFEKLAKISDKVGKGHLIVDLSCRTVINETGEVDWFVAMNKWQTITGNKLSKEFLLKVSSYCDELLIHAADVEGLCKGIDEKLVLSLSNWCPPNFEGKIVYAGGAKSLEDLQLVRDLSNGKVDLTFGSALDIFGGKLVKFDDLIRWNQKNS